jgi:hypothetical protein
MVSVDLDDKSLSTVLVDADGRSERILSWKQENLATGEAAELAVTPLESGASSTPIYQSLGAHGAVLALPDGEDWFVLREGRPAYDEPVVSVYRADGAVTLVGTLDTLWAIGVDYKYRTGERSLEPGPSAYVGHCDQNGCGSYRFFLDPVRLEEVASRALPEPGLRGHYSRRLACGGADFWVVTRDGPEAPMRFWSLRIPGRAGFP